jgi:aryl-alcohol dehydrogenase-like predicted oxidoreductase
VAGERGVSRAQVALAWLLHKPAVTAPFFGATKPHHVADADAVVDLKLSDDDLARLEADYVPHLPEGF